MAQYTNRRYFMVQCMLVCMAVDAIRQATDNRNVVRLDRFHKISANGLSVWCSVAGADNADHARCVQVGISFIIKQKWRISTFGESLRIPIIPPKKRFDVVFFNKLKFFFGSFEHLCTRKPFDHPPVQTLDAAKISL